MKTQIRQFKIVITGTTPLLLHSHSVDWMDTMEAWKADPNNKKKGKAGDDRTPAWRWIGSLYVDENLIVMPSDNIMTMLREGANRVPTGKKTGTFKAMSQTGIIVDQPAWPILVDGKTVPYGPIQDIADEEDYSVHKATALKLGFCLFCKPCKIGMSKHLRVRPRFDQWQISGTVTVLEDQITTEILKSILIQAGHYCGLGDWRGSSPRSMGSFGQFNSEVTPV